MKSLQSKTIAVHVRYKSLYISLPFSSKQQRKMTPGGGGGYSLIRAYWGRAASQGMFFGIFVLNGVSNLSFFVLIRVSVYQFLS